MLGFSEIGIIGAIVLILLLFAVAGFVKGLLKTVMALLTLAGAGFSSWWAYHYVPGWLTQRVDNVPDSTGVVCAALGGAVSFYLLYRVFYFVAHPFEMGEEGEKQKGRGWSFGLPAAFISVLLAVVFVGFCINRMRTTDQLEQIKEIMTHGREKAEHRTGVGKWLMDALSSNSVGDFLLEHDPLWPENKAKLVRLVILYFQSGPDAMAENQQVSQLLQDPTFQEWVVQQGELLAAMKSKDALSLWDADCLDDLLKNEEVRSKLDAIPLQELQ